MYNVILAIHFIGIVIIAAETAHILAQRPSRYQTILIFLLMALMINFIGAFIEITAQSAEQALLGIRFSYVGKPFVIYSMFLFVTNFSRVRLPVGVHVFMLVETLCICVCAFTCPYHDWFYTTREFVYTGLFPHMVLGKGIVYNFHSVVLCILFVYFAYCCVHQVRRSRSKNERSQALSLAAILIVCVCGYVAFYSGAAGGYDTTLLGYVIGMIILIHSIVRNNLFETLTLASEQAVIDYRDGLVVLNQYGELVLLNKVASNVVLSMRPSLELLVKSVAISEGGSSLNEKSEVLEAALQENAVFASERVKKMKDVQKELDGLVLELHEYSTTKKPLFACNEVFSINERAVTKKGVDYGKVFEITVITENYYYAERLESDVEAKTREIRSIQRKATISFASVVEARDDTTGMHIVNTSKYVEMIAQELSRRVEKDPGSYSEEFKKLLDPWYLATIVDAAPLHDFGKIYVPDAVLTKPGKLTSEEFEEIKKHPHYGADLIEKTLRGIETDEYVEVAKQIALGHHERWDGTGYPNKTAGDDIPLSARIMAVADVYDALRQKRQYKEAYPVEKALGIIKEESGTHFDPRIVDAFVSAIERVRITQEAFAISDSL